MTDSGDPSLSPDGLSFATRQVWAKHVLADEAWLPLWRHMADSGAVMARLWDRWLPEQARRVVSADLPEGAADARRLAVWLATLHDLGKATPAFAFQVDRLANQMRTAGLDMPTRGQLEGEHKKAPHGLAGQVLLQRWLTDVHGWDTTRASQLATIIGGHHGVQPTNMEVAELARSPQLLYSRSAADAWSATQHELLDWAATGCAVLTRLADWASRPLSQPTQVILSGLVIVADWFASSRDFFPLDQDADLTNPQRVSAAWHALNLPRPWEPVVPREDAQQLLGTRFDLPEGASARPVQAEAIRMARAMDTSGMMLIEAPMGEGKTEAALAAAEILAARTGAGGCFVALPTMATGNAMFDRITGWLQHLPDHRAGTGAHSVALAHSKAALNDTYIGLPREPRYPAMDMDRDSHQQPARTAAPAQLVAHHWLRGRKKAMLASFVVGTIDQLLFAGLKSRHLALRHLAISGKVIVIDEVHAYDTYMSTYLERVLGWLGAYGVPVVVLSATLPADRRQELARSYLGRHAAGPELEQLAENRDYPLLAAVGHQTSLRLSAPAASGRSNTVELERVPDDPELLAQRLRAELAGGGCAVVVRNTVRRVHETAQVLRAEFARAEVDIPVTVAHARFVDADRLARDAWLLDHVGPHSEQNGTRPVDSAHVVVASQVVEQSLDVDFDLMVTDLAPIDLMLQRMGRLHRHPRQRPARLHDARCLVTGADWAVSPPQPDTGSLKVYRSYPLLRAAAVLESRLAAHSPEQRRVHLPGDINPLIQSAYGSGEAGPDAWQPAMAEAHAAEELHAGRQRDEAREFRLAAPKRPGSNLLGWVAAGVGDADDSSRGRAQVRDSDDTLEVLVVQQRNDGVFTTLPWLAENGGQELPTDAPPPAWLARTVAQCALRLPFPFTISRLLDQAIAELEDTNHIPAWQVPECYHLAGELILPLDENGRTRLAGLDLTYTPADGLEVHYGR
ncbi:CRISPR-associated helicase Cas3' [Lipingzhangella sp. LS1_29]|uniref:CRISPR-associated helicase Cas3 n=1 Tax=Lipingzhangella rawalii TaxID=2055835 RepID=A0ABU2HBT0_9ACTN|nr:CRISPR-associated helicase Cas3' [Lipingzhangella rawalii]MDS1272255.1 CRISPR-associated helicase Cas3' [Lipingzhangella rawalii]